MDSLRSRNNDLKTKGIRTVKIRNLATIVTGVGVVGVVLVSVSVSVTM